MEIHTAGKVVVSARIENLGDLDELKKGALAADRVRSVEVTDALVDTGVAMLSLPRKMIRQLGLRQRRTGTTRTVAGTAQCGIYDAVRLTIQQRVCIIKVTELPDESPVLIGQIPLVALDLVVDPAGQKLVGKPKHRRKRMRDSS